MGHTEQDGYYYSRLRYEAEPTTEVERRRLEMHLRLDLVGEAATEKRMTPVEINLPGSFS